MRLGDVLLCIAKFPVWRLCCSHCLFVVAYGDLHSARNLSFYFLLILFQNSSISVFVKQWQSTRRVEEDTRFGAGLNLYWKTWCIVSAKLVQLKEQRTVLLLDMTNIRSNALYIQRPVKQRPFGFLFCIWPKLLLFFERSVERYLHGEHIQIQI